MNIRNAVVTTSAAAVMTLGLGAPAFAAPADRAVSQSGGAAAGLVAAVVQVNDVQVVNVQNSPITVDDVVTIGDVNINIEDVLNNNRVLQNILNNNDVNIEDVVDIEIVDNVLIVVVDAL